MSKFKYNLNRHYIFIIFYLITLNTAVIKTNAQNSILGSSLKNYTFNEVIDCKKQWQSIVKSAMLTEVDDKDSIYKLLREIYPEYFTNSSDTSNNLIFKINNPNALKLGSINFNHGYIILWDIPYDLALSFGSSLKFIFITKKYNANDIGSYLNDNLKEIISVDSNYNNVYLKLDKPSFYSINPSSLGTLVKFDIMAPTNYWYEHAFIKYYTNKFNIIDSTYIFGKIKFNTDLNDELVSNLLIKKVGQMGSWIVHEVNSISEKKIEGIYFDDYKIFTNSLNNILFCQFEKSNINSALFSNIKNKLEIIWGKPRRISQNSNEFVWIGYNIIIDITYSPDENILTMTVSPYPPL
jgi:hypothetical protein